MQSPYFVEMKSCGKYNRIECCVKMGNIMFINLIFKVNVCNLATWLDKLFALGNFQAQAYFYFAVSTHTQGRCMCKRFALR